MDPVGQNARLLAFATTASALTNAVLPLSRLPDVLLLLMRYVALLHPAWSAHRRTPAAISAAALGSIVRRRHAHAYIVWIQLHLLHHSGLELPASPGHARCASYFLTHSTLQHHARSSTNMAALFLLHM